MKYDPNTESRISNFYVSETRKGTWTPYRANKRTKWNWKRTLLVVKYTHTPKFTNVVLFSQEKKKKQELFNYWSLWHLLHSLYVTGVNESGDTRGVHIAKQPQHPFIRTLVSVRTVVQDLAKCSGVNIFDVKMEAFEGFCDVYQKTTAPLWSLPQPHYNHSSVVENMICRQKGLMFNFWFL